MDGPAQKRPLFVPVDLTKWPPGPDSLFWFAEFQKSSSIKLLGTNSTKLCKKWWIDGSPQKFLYFNPVEQTKWPPEPILYFDLPNFKRLFLWNYWARIQPNFAGMICMDGPSQKVHYLSSGWTIKMAARANSLFWLVDFQKIFSETTGPNITKHYSTCHVVILTVHAMSLF